MKKWLIIPAVILLLFIIGVYIFIPPELKIAQLTPVKSTPNGTLRLLSDKSKWNNYWDSSRFALSKVLPHGIDITIRQNDLSIPSRIIINPLQADSVELLWQCSFPSGNNPFKRISRYRQAVTLKQEFAAIQNKLKSYLEKTENVYGYSIRQTSTTDTMLIATRVSANTYPSTEEIYGHINQLKSYAAANGAQQTGYPMLNISQPGDQFQYMIALPVNKQLPDQGSFFSRRMVPGNFMMTEVKGGLQTINHALTQLQLYAQDHRRTSMAIPFQLLVTDRIKEQDTSKWVTRIYYPVM
jgi:hypothetical protein